MTTVAVVIPNLNGASFLPGCLEALRRQSRLPTEIVVVDNGSTDDSRALLAQRFPEVRVIPHSRNLGVARAFNAGIRHTTSAIVVLLNNDTEVEPAWLEELVRPLESPSDVAMTTSKVLLFARRSVLHSAGDRYGRDGMPGNRGVWQEDRGQFDHDLFPFGACGAAAAYRRSLFDDLGLFDEGLESYCEDVDLNVRAQLAGYRCQFVPSARVYHHLSATGGGPLASYYVGRNVIWVIARDLPSPVLRRYWPMIFGRQLAITGECLRHWREPAARARLRGQLDGWRGMGRMLLQRAAIQARRRVSIAAFEATLT